MVITISNRYGSGGVAVARMVAQRLQYELIDEQLPVVVAKSMSQRVLRALESGTPELRAPPDDPFDEEPARVQETVRAYAAKGNVVIVGRGAHAILEGRENVLRVFMHAPRDWRIERVMEAHAIDLRTAACEVDRVDRARTDYMRAYFDEAWTDQENYDIAIDTSTFGFAGSAEIIVRAVDAR